MKIVSIVERRESKSIDPTPSETEAEGTEKQGQRIN